jgi:cell division protein FtsX
MVETAQFDARWAKRLYGMVELGKQLTWFLGGALGIALVLVTTMRYGCRFWRDAMKSKWPS